MYFHSLIIHCRVGSVYSTLAVTLERFSAIVFPFKDFDTIKKWLVPSTVIFTIAYNLPKFFELKTYTDPETGLTSIRASGLRQNAVYRSAYVFWSKFLLIELIPYILVVIMNSFIIVKIVKSSRFRQKIMHNMSQQTPFKDVAVGNRLQSMSEEQIKFFENQRQEHKLGGMLIAISLLFITCQSFKLIPDMYEVLFCRDTATHQCITTAFVNKVVTLSHLLVCFNSAANFVIYLLGGEKFRTAWIQTYVPLACIRGCGCASCIRSGPAVHGGGGGVGAGGAGGIERSQYSMRRNNSFRSSYMRHPQTQLVRLNTLNGQISRTESSSEGTTFTPPDLLMHVEGAGRRQRSPQEWLGTPTTTVSATGISPLHHGQHGVVLAAETTFLLTPDGGKKV